LNCLVSFVLLCIYCSVLRLLIRRDWEIHRHIHGTTLRKSKLKPFSVFSVNPWAFSEPILSKTCDSLAWLW
jgi:hypothetical protein